MQSLHIRRHRGSILVYSLFLMVIMLSVLSLAVDYGRVQVIKTQLQRDADATARGALQMYTSDGSSTAYSIAPSMANQQYNPVEGNSGIAPTVTITWGYWNTATKTFSTGTGSPIAVQVTVARTKANGNPVPLTFPLMNGLSALITNCDVQASATAYLQPPITSTAIVPGTGDIWLSGMPAGSTAHSGQDNTDNCAPTQLGLNMVPGTVLTFSVTGGTAYCPGGALYGADGNGGVNWNQYFLGGSGCQNGIQTINAPGCALLGVFLTNAAPNTQTPPASGLDYSTPASQNQNVYSKLLTQQPFFIGDGLTTSSTTQSFIVPPGATRLFLGSYDPNNNNDNGGSLTVTVTQQAQVFLVK